MMLRCTWHVAIRAKIKIRTCVIYKVQPDATVFSLFYYVILYMFRASPIFRSTWNCLCSLMLMSCFRCVVMCLLVVFGVFRGSSYVLVSVYEKTVASGLTLYMTHIWIKMHGPTNIKKKKSTMLFSLSVEKCNALLGILCMAPLPV